MSLAPPVLLSLLAFTASAVHAPSSQHIVGGADASVCDFPAAVLVVATPDDPEVQRHARCTAALVHPQLIVTAAHCLAPDLELTSIRFGEDVLSDPPRSVDITTCIGHPDHDDWARNDLAVCSLAEPVEDVPIVPPLMGCEAAVLQPGTDVVQVGYGHSSTDPDEGIGRKRWAPMRIEAFRWTENDLVLTHTGNGTSCRGDSGGPTYVQLEDGSWRLAAVLSSGHPNTTLGCDLGSVVERVDGLMPWIEEVTNVDITPCHDADGTWNPGPDCGGFPLELLASEGHAWEAGCGGAELSGFSEACGAPFEPEEPGSTGGDETDGDETEGDIETTGGADTTGGGTDGVATTDAAGDGSSSGAGQDEADSGGCSVGSGGSSSGGIALALLALVGLRRRNERAAS